AEWNYAAAGGTAQRLYPWGTTSPTCALANFFGGSGATDYCYSSFTIGVGVLGGNGSYGQSDLAGNVQEWTLDSHAVAATAFFEPCDDCAYLSSTPTSRVTRGGMFSSVASALTTTSRLETSHT